LSLDGAYLNLIKQEIEAVALDARIDKIYQPSREEIVLGLRGRGWGARLLLSASADSARVHFTENRPENPAVPPMFCMLLRKLLGSARLSAVRQLGLDRVLFLDFDTHNELGDEVTYTLVTEIMGGIATSSCSERKREEKRLSTRSSGWTPTCRRCARFCPA
jgi:predicted ribosome quality control (RQC) complex YloA/Tae2 family protein